jgi:hypothetical protein
VVAVDAGAMQIQWCEGAVLRRVEHLEPETGAQIDFSNLTIQLTTPYDILRET